MARKQFKPLKFAQGICKELELIYQSDDMLYLYHQDGYWKAIHSDHIQKAALGMIGPSAKSAHLSDVRRLVETLSLMDQDKQFDEYNGHCNIRSGMLNLKTLELKPHHKDHLSRIQLPVTYDGNATCPQWKRVLDEIFEGDSERICVVQEFFGYCLVPDTSYQKALIFLGEGANGKSLILQILEELLGRQNICNISLADLSNEFQRVRLHGKLVNIATEIDPKTLEKSDHFKAVVTGDSISAAHKHKPGFDFRPVARLIFACNRMPRVRDTSHAYYRRLLFVPFNRRFEGDEADRHLPEKLKPELDGIFNWCRRGLMRLHQQDHFTESEMGEAALKEYKRMNNPVVAFVEDVCRLDFEKYTSKNSLYLEYKKYTQNGGYSAMSEANFFRELYAACPTLEGARHRTDAGREYIVRGIVVEKLI